MFVNIHLFRNFYLSKNLKDYLVSYALNKHLTFYSQLKIPIFYINTRIIFRSWIKNFNLRAIIVIKKMTISKIYSFITNYILYRFADKIPETL